MTGIRICISMDIYICTYVHIDEAVEKGKYSEKITIFQFFLSDFAVTEPKEAEPPVRRQRGIKKDSCPWSFLVVGNIKKVAPSKLPHGAWDFLLREKLGP